MACFSVGCGTRTDSEWRFHNNESNENLELMSLVAGTSMPASSKPNNKGETLD
jgi:hypothetical protein